jgi:hypothetical protein
VPATIYDIRVKYMLDDKASKGMTAISKQANRASKEVTGLQRGMRRLLVAGAGFMTFRLGKKWLIDYNAELEQARTTMTTLLMQGMGGEWARNQQRANVLIKQFQKDAAVSVGTTIDYVNVAKLITGPLTKAGASMEDLREITQGTAVAAETYGIEADVAARDVQQMIMGNVRAVDRFARMLGVVPVEWNKMVREKGPRQALEEVSKLFKQPALVAATKAYGKTWAGITSTLEDNIQRALGKVGLPLMQAISKELVALTKWFEENPEKVNQIAKSIADSLVGGFKAVKAIFKFIIDHKRLLMTIAKAVLITKAVGFVGGLGRSLMPGLNTLSGGAEAAGQSLFGFEKGVKGLASGIGRAIGILGTVAVGAKVIADIIDERQEKELARKARTVSVRAEAPKLGVVGGRAVDVRKAMGLEITEAQRKAMFNTLLFGEQAKFIKDGKLDMDAIARGLRIERVTLEGIRGWDTEKKGMLKGELRQAQQIMLGLERALAMQSDRYAKSTGEGMMKFGRLFFLNWEKMRKVATPRESKIETAITLMGNLAEGLYSFLGMEIEEEKKAAAGKKQTNIHVHKIEVVSDDPDRFAFNLVGAFQDVVKNPTQAANALREG